MQGAACKYFQRWLCGSAALVPLVAPSSPCTLCNNAPGRALTSLILPLTVALHPAAAESTLAVGECGGAAAQARQLAAQLQHRLEQHQRASKPLTLCCMDPAAPPVGDCAMLDAFAAQVCADPPTPYALGQFSIHACEFQYPAQKCKMSVSKGSGPERDAFNLEFVQSLEAYALGPSPPASWNESPLPASDTRGVSTS